MLIVVPSLACIVLDDGKGHVLSFWRDALLAWGDVSPRKQPLDSSSQDNEVRDVDCALHTCLLIF